jgi:hypothetical protein
MLGAGRDSLHCRIFTVAIIASAGVSFYWLKLYALNVQ